MQDIQLCGRQDDCSQCIGLLRALPLLPILSLPRIAAIMLYYTVRKGGCVMATITFQAHIMNGMIEIPAMYRDQFPDTIQVLVMATP